MRRFAVGMVMVIVVIILSIVVAQAKVIDIQSDKILSAGDVVASGVDQYGDIVKNATSVISGFEYKYTGINNNSIEILHKTSEQTFSRYDSLERPNEVKEEKLSLPLNQKKQALLKIEFKGDTKELLVTVVDDFYRIKVEEYRP